MQRRFFFAGPLILLAAAILLWATPTLTRVIADPGPDSTTTTVPTAPPSGDTCATTVHFFAQDVGGHKFGPAVTEEVNAAQADLRNRLCSDPALAVALQEDVSDTFSSPDERVDKTAALVQNPDAWRLTVLAVTNAVAQGNPRVETMSGSYKTLYMVTEGRQIPEVFNASPDKPSFGVLRFDTPQGVKNLKLDCGFQPVEQSFPPAVPPRTQPPSPRQPKQPPKPPTTVTPPTTAPPTVTTQPPATTVPPSPTTTWKCDKGWKLVGGQWVCGTGGDVGTPPYQPPSTLPPTPGFNPATTVPGSTIPPGATPPVSFAPTPPPEAPVTTDPPAQGDPCQSASPPAFC
ncbi:hypothetical protein IT415_00155 [bacterium]|nr:hypothetical protein [bacterium]